MTKWKSILNLEILKFISESGICDEGAAKLGEYVSKLLNLTGLNLSF
jgi:hypothetical protein